MTQHTTEPSQSRAQRPGAASNLITAPDSQIITPSTSMGGRGRGSPEDLEKHYAELEREMQLLGSPDKQEYPRDEQGRWTGPYIRFNGVLKKGEPDIILEDGRRVRYTSFAAAFVANQPHTLILEIDMEEIRRIVLSDRGGAYGVGHLTNGMTLDAVGPKSAAVMAAAPNYSQWKRKGTLTNQKDKDSTDWAGAGKRAVLNLFAGVRLPPANEKGRSRLVVRNYAAIERDRLRAEGKR